MSDVLIRIEGRAGRVTLNRPKALNALTWDMCLAIEEALDAWRDDPDVALVVIDGAGDRAFCAGGDIADIYRTISEGDFDYGRRFWADEYRLNAKIAGYPKPYIAFMQGYTMGGGVGVSCHGSHRIVGDTSRIAMPECGIGLVPDVGGSLLLAHAPGRTGEYLGLTTTRMGPGDAIFAGFADSIVPEADWPDLIATLERTGDAGVIADAACPPPEAPLVTQQAAIARHFGAATLAEVWQGLASDNSDFAATARTALARVSPLSAAVTLDLVRRVRADPTMANALTLERRVTWRAAEHGDLVEGIRTTIIDKDDAPRWRHAAPDRVTADEVAAMLAPLPPGTPPIERGDAP